MKNVLILLVACILASCTKQTCENWDVVETCQSLQEGASCLACPDYKTIVVCGEDVYADETVIIYEDKAVIKRRVYIQRH
jgi:hypothetical protein